MRPVFKTHRIARMSSESHLRARCRYHGQWKQGERSGFGRWVLPDGVVAFAGNWDDDLPCGTGWDTTPRQTTEYPGVWTDGTRRHRGNR